jgi:ribonuclease III
MIPKSTLKAIEKKLGYRFRKRAHLQQALIHPSYRHENKDVTEDNQRLEFLGDAALGLVSAADLYHRFADEAEGPLTHMRSAMANRTTLARIARTLELGHHLLLGKGELRSGGPERESNLADALEAVLGAVYLDGGLKAVEKIYRRLWGEALAHVAPDLDDNPKGELQEYCQQRWKVNPAYRITREQGPAHARSYVCVATIKDIAYGEGTGSTRRTAEAAAARATLAQLDISD